MTVSQDKGSSERKFPKKVQKDTKRNSHDSAIDEKEAEDTKLLGANTSKAKVCLCLLITVVFYAIFAVTIYIVRGNTAKESGIRGIYNKTNIYELRPRN